MGIFFVWNSLTSLNLSWTKIKDTGAQYISEMQRLTSLDLSGNSIGDTGALHISKMRGLTSLILRDNLIGNARVMDISRMKGLTFSDLSVANTTNSRNSDISQNQIENANLPNSTFPRNESTPLSRPIPSESVQRLELSNLKLESDEF